MNKMSMESPVVQSIFVNNDACQVDKAGSLKPTEHQLYAKNSGRTVETAMMQNMVNGIGGDCQGELEVAINELREAIPNEFKLGSSYVEIVKSAINYIHAQKNATVCNERPVSTVMAEHYLLKSSLGVDRNIEQVNKSYMKQKACRAEEKALYKEIRLLLSMDRQTRDDLMKSACCFIELCQEKHMKMDITPNFLASATASATDYHDFYHNRPRSEARRLINKIQRDEMNTCFKEMKMIMDRHSGINLPTKSNKVLILENAVNLIRECKNNHTRVHGLEEIRKDCYQIESLRKRNCRGMLPYKPSEDSGCLSQSKEISEISTENQQPQPAYDGLLTSEKCGFTQQSLPFSKSTFFGSYQVPSESLRPQVKLPSFSSWVKAPKSIIYTESNPSGTPSQKDCNIIDVQQAVDAENTLDSEITYITL